MLGELKPKGPKKSDHGWSDRRPSGLACQATRLPPHRSSVWSAPFPLSLSLSLCLSERHTHTLSLSERHTHTHSLSLSERHTHTHTIHTHTHTHTHTLITLSHTHTHSTVSASTSATTVSASTSRGQWVVNALAHPGNTFNLNEPFCLGSTRVSRRRKLIRRLTQFSLGSKLKQGIGLYIYMYIYTYIYILSKLS